MSNKLSKVYEFGPFLFYPDDRKLQCNDQPSTPPRTVMLPDRAMDVLMVLFEKRDDPGVESKELLKKVWGAKGGDPSNLTHAIKNLKDRLRECDKDCEYIENIRGGYRFKAFVREIESGSSSLPDIKSTGRDSAPSKTVVPDPLINKEPEASPKTELTVSSSTDEILSGDNNTTKKQWQGKAAAGVSVVVIVLLVALLVALRRGQNERPIEAPAKVENNFGENQKPVDNFIGQQQALYFYQKGWSLYKEADKLKEKKQMELAQEKYNQAEAFLRQAIQLYPDRPLYHSALGWALYDQNKTDDARQAFMSVLALKSTHGEESSAHHGLGLIYEDIDNLGEAERHLKEAVRLAPQDELEVCKEDLERILKKKER